MNWSAYSRMVGNVSGAPLAMEGLAAFMLESTFLGLWIFGWDKLSKRVHLLTIWLVFAGTILSAAFILMANSWMQHPVGYQMVHGQPQLTNIWALMTNPVFLWGYTHVVLDSTVTGGRRDAGRFRLAAEKEAREAVPLGLMRLAFARDPFVLVLLLDMFVGSELGVIEARYQPMKIAASEAQWSTCQPCSFSLFQIGGGNNDHTPTQIFSIPHLLSLLATNSWNGKVIGLGPLQHQYAARYGPGSYVPNVFIQYWSMRVMAYLACSILLVGLAGLVLMRKKKVPSNRWFLLAATWVVILPFVMNTAGWLLTESGRQPWVVQGILLTRHAVSPSVSFTDLVISLIAFGLLYTALGVIDAVLMIRYSRRELEAAPAATDSDAGASRPVDVVLIGGFDDSRLALVPDHRGRVDRVLRARRLRLRGRHAARRARPGRGFYGGP